MKSVTVHFKQLFTTMRLGALCQFKKFLMLL